VSGHRRHIDSGTVWEARAGYSRAVRVGNLVFVAGTTCDGPDAYAQLKGAIARIEQALEEAGASLDDIVRTRIFVTSMNDFDLIAKAHHEAFGDIRPAATLVEVSRLVSPGLLVEIEADAYLD
jgi:enamine deaminase RidA (YjgF/YER057c/UK114 family)